MRIILASKSPRRRELLQLLGLDFDIIAADIDETINPALAIEDELSRLSRQKAEAVMGGGDDIIISADTIVIYNNEIMGKPKNRADAERMLKLLSGNTHRVITGVTVKSGNKTLCETVTTKVTFKPLCADEILRYIDSGECDDKAGAYAIQGGGAVFVEQIQGDYFNVVGLPVCTLGKMLSQFGIYPNF